jgi:hypothetical protein
MSNKEEMNTSTLTTIKSVPISLYPNPTSDYFQITGIVGTALVTISDLHCRVLLKKQIDEDEKISVVTLPKGVFIAKISTASHTVERKLVKKSDA